MVRGSKGLQMRLSQSHAWSTLCWLLEILAPTTATADMRAAKTVLMPAIFNNDFVGDRPYIIHSGGGQDCHRDDQEHDKDKSIDTIELFQKREVLLKVVT